MEKTVINRVAARRSSVVLRDPVKNRLDIDALRDQPDSGERLIVGGAEKLLVTAKNIFGGALDCADVQF
ncbi:MAG TPA: hypothetical protein VGH63_09095 [Polyangia bacterium]|jgi:hypothetical protein